MSTRWTWAKTHPIVTALIIGGGGLVFWNSACWMAWIETHPNTALWVQGIGTLAAAVIALIGARMILLGAREQANAPLQLQAQIERNTRAAIANALIGELIETQRRLAIMPRNLRRVTEIKRGKELPLFRTKMPVFDAQLDKLGSIGADLVPIALKAYHSVEYIRLQIDWFLEVEDLVTVAQIGQLASQIETCAAECAASADDLRERLG